MNKEFLSKVNELVKSGENVFYNNHGSKLAYQLCVKHASAIPAFELGFLVSGRIYLNDKIYLVDFDNETINETYDSIELVPLD